MATGEEELCRWWSDSLHSKIALRSGACQGALFFRAIPIPTTHMKEVAEGDTVALGGLRPPGVEDDRRPLPRDRCERYKSVLHEE